MPKQSSFKLLGESSLRGLECVYCVPPRAARSLANGAETTAFGAPKVLGVEDTLMVGVLGKLVISLVVKDELRIGLLAEFCNLMLGLDAVSREENAQDLLYTRHNPPWRGP